ncbi:MAG: quinohemoprotein amine dehydrogenase maturation protein [Alphaproteobacteria bacterium]|nr:quinohemoprotein amine dehydrogenase maturation protein [Alphaproteobacteria bacterium]MBU6471332.1 quinohemoprotein amine dehydrogenase maturation protein [Alphaproteobacteria bacterium]
MESLRLIPHNLHDVQVADRRVLFHVPTTALFEADAVTCELIDFFRARPAVSADELQQAFEGRYDAGRIAGVLQELIELEVIQPAANVAAPVAPLRIEKFPVNTLVLNVNTGCNLSCTYCYKEDLSAPAQGKLMGADTARRSIDLLMDEGGEHGKVNLVFFGGEPLSNLPLIKEAVAYAEERGRARGLQVDFSLTTNATLLTEEIIAYLDDHRFGLTVSMDGPRHLHDKRRVTVGGKGTYDVVARKVELLLSRYRSRPVGARVTLTAGVTEVETIFAHLKNELGFAEVGLAPVTSGDNALFNLNEAELAAVFAGFRNLAEDYRSAALDGRYTGFTNIHKLVSDLTIGRRKSLPCGAGVGLLAVDHQGDLHLCHRFTGSSLPAFGSVADGIDKPRLGAFLSEAADHEGDGCATCRIRTLCAGGCYHERYARYGDPLHPAYHYCELMRDWVDLGIRIFAELEQSNPQFLARYAGRRISNIQGG